MNEKLRNYIENVKPLDEAAMAAARKRQGQLAKPLGSLGMLEELSVQMAGITGKLHNTPDNRRIIVLCADNGVCEEGVSVTPQSVTLAQTINLTRALTGASVLAKYTNTKMTVADVGVKAHINCPDVLDYKIAMGTKNLAKEPAMTYEQAVKGILIGIELAEKAADEGTDIVGVGEMGIGNTTTSTAVICALTGADPEEVTGVGGGLTDAMLIRKKQVIKQALIDRAPDKNDVCDVLSKVGGFDLCAMTGVFIGCAFRRIPVVVDGVISAAAALCACRLCENARGYMIGSHHSADRAYQAAEKALELKPCLYMDMRLGEGSGCAVMFPIVSAACYVLNNMATFEEAAINDDYLDPLREEQ